MTLGQIFLTKRRADGQADDLVIVGIIPQQNGDKDDHGLAPFGSMVTLPEVHASNVGTCDYVLNEGLTVFVNAQCPKRITRSTTTEPMLEEPQESSGGYDQLWSCGSMPTSSCPHSHAYRP